ncbi:MAG: enoyl-CoA hydratase [Sphingomonadaceae bacterium]
MAEPALRVERDGPIGWMIFDNPARRNAINEMMWRAIPKAMAGFDADPGVRCVVLRGAGDVAFAAGADISEFEKRRANPDAAGEHDNIIDAAQFALEESAKPVLAMIHGYCLGGGLEIALACDLRYAGASSSFAIPAARLGIGYGVHGTNRLVASVGHAAAREIMLTGRRYAADEALAMGLVNRVLPDAELEGYVRTIASELAANAPLSMAASKAIINSVIESQGDFSKGEALVQRCAKSEDHVEGRRAFMEKRTPKFKGK